MNILAFSNGTGSLYYRLIPQLRRLKQIEHKINIEKWDENKLISKQQILWSDVIILEMIFSASLIKYIKKIKPQVRVIIEIDDAVEGLPKSHYNHKSGFEALKYAIRTRYAVYKADKVIVSTEYLYNFYKRYNKNILLFKNYCDLLWWLKPYKENKSKQIRLLWAGSNSHYDDLMMVKPALKYILEKYPEVKFIYIGYGGINSDNPYAQFIYGEDIFKELPDNRELMLSVPPEIWPQRLASLGADVAIAPVIENKFNRAKSTCKYLEYSINKIPAIYSGWKYKEVVKQGETGFLANNIFEWIKYLEMLIKDKELRNKIKENAYNDVIKNHNVENYLDNWVKFVCE